MGTHCLVPCLVLKALDAYRFSARFSQQAVARLSPHSPQTMEAAHCSRASASDQLLKMRRCPCRTPRDDTGHNHVHCEQPRVQARSICCFIAATSAAALTSAAAAFLAARRNRLGLFPSAQSKRRKNRFLFAKRLHFRDSLLYQVYSNEVFLATKPDAKFSNSL